MFHSEEFQDLGYLDILEINELCLPLSTGGRIYVGRSRKKEREKKVRDRQEGFQCLKEVKLALRSDPVGTCKNSLHYSGLCVFLSSCIQDWVHSRTNIYKQHNFTI